MFVGRRKRNHLITSHLLPCLFCDALSPLVAPPPVCNVVMLRCPGFEKRFGDLLAIGAFQTLELISSCPSQSEMLRCLGLKKHFVLVICCKGSFPVDSVDPFVSEVVRKLVFSFSQTKRSIGLSRSHFGLSSLTGFGLYYLFSVAFYSLRQN